MFGFTNAMLALCHVTMLATNFVNPQVPVPGPTTIIDFRPVAEIIEVVIELIYLLSLVSLTSWHVDPCDKHVRVLIGQVIRITSIFSARVVLWSIYSTIEEFFSLKQALRNDWMTFYWRHEETLVSRFISVLIVIRNVQADKQDAIRRFPSDLELCELPGRISSALRRYYQGHEYSRAWSFIRKCEWAYYYGPDRNVYWFDAGINDRGEQTYRCESMYMKPEARKSI